MGSDCGLKQRGDGHFAPALGFGSASIRDSHLLSVPLQESKASERAAYFMIKNNRDDNVRHPCNLLFGSLAILIPPGGILDP